MSRLSSLRSLGLRAFLPIGLLLGSGSAAHAATQAAPSTSPDAFDAIMGPELVVNETRFTKSDLMRAVVTGRVGSTAIEAIKLRLLIAQEVARRVKEGANPADFLVSQADIDGAVKEQADYLKESYPDGHYTVENMMDGGLKAFKTQLQLTKLFNRIFLPEGDPGQFPAITLAALKQSEMGSKVLEQLASDWDTNKLRQTPMPKNPLLRSILFKEIFDYLQSTSTISRGSAVPADVILRINEDDITVLDVWNEVSNLASADDMILAKKWLRNMHLLRSGLADVWLSSEEAEARFAEHAEPFEKSMIPMKNFALGVKRYPSMTAYREYRHAHDSFKKSIKSEITPDVLRQFAELRTRKLVGGATIDVDVILVSAYDFQNRKWKADGWAKAEERAREVVQRLQAKEDWDTILDEYSEFYDAPANIANPQAAKQLKYKGRFRNLGRNELMQKLGEDDFQAFVNGGTLADFIFFSLDEGSVGGVKKGPHGWYIPLLRKRTTKPIRNNQEQLITMAEQDYVDVNLAIFLNDLIKNAKVEGLF